MDTAEPVALEINPALDMARHRQELKERNSFPIRLDSPLKEDSARILLGRLSAEPRWGLRLSDGRNILGVPPELYAKYDEKEIGEAIEIAYAAARSGFGFFREETWGPWIDPAAAPNADAALGHFWMFAQSETFLSIFVRLLAAKSVRLVRLSASRYSSGHFFGFAPVPRDANIGFSLDLTPHWELEWGGVLQFLDSTGGIGCCQPPRFNVMHIYPLSRPPGVSVVSPFAGATHYSISGELRAK